MKIKLNKVFMENNEFFIILKGKGLFDNLDMIKLKIDGLYFLKLKYCSRKEIAPNVIKIKLRKNLNLCPAGAPKKFTKEEIENIKKKLEIK